MRLLTGASALALLLAALPGCEVRALVTGRPGYRCDTDADCDPGMVCRAAAGDSDRRCWEEAPPPDGGGVVDPRADEGSSDDTDTDTVACTIVPSCADLTHVATCEGPAAPGGLMKCPAGTRCDAGACIDAGTVRAEFYVSLTRQDGQAHGDISGGFWYEAEFEDPEVVAEGTCRELGGGNARRRGVAFDAGVVRVGGLAGGEHTVSFDPEHAADPGAQTYYRRFVQQAGETYPFGRTVGIEDAGGGLLGPFAAQVEVPPDRRVTSPTSDSQLVRGSPMMVTWSGATREGAVDILLQSGSYPVWCRAPDTGSFLADARVLDLAGPLFVAVIENRRTPLKADGLDTGFLIASVLDVVTVELVDAQP